MYKEVTLRHVQTHRIQTQHDRRVPLLCTLPRQCHNTQYHRHVDYMAQVKKICSELIFSYAESPMNYSLNGYSFAENSAFACQMLLYLDQ